MEGEPSEKVARVRLGSYEFKKKGISRFDLRDPYHLAVALTWPQFLAALLALYLSVNIVFATLFWLAPGSVANTRPGSLGDAFFFSIETLATVGYGEMYPATPYGRVVAATEIVCGLAFTAILTGLAFVRFSRPRARLVFAANPVVAMHNGKPTLMVRIGNGRAAGLSDAKAQLNVLLSETSAEGNLFHRAQERAARAGTHSVLSTLLDPDARARRTESTLWLRFGASNRGEGASVRAARSARPNARDNRARQPQLWARGYTLRDAL
jgi:hypothetical protein